MTFTNYDNNEEAVEPRVLTVEEKMGLTDDFIAGKTITGIKHEKFIPTSLIKQSFNKKKAIEKHVVKLMRQQVLISPAVYGEDGELVSEAVYNNKPSTLTGLKSVAYEAFSSCDQEAFDYNVDKIVESATTSGTWTSFKEVFN